MEKDKAQLAHARLALERARVSAKPSLIDKATSAHERALARLRRSEDVIARREAALRTAENDLERAHARAPTDGTVTVRGVAPGRRVEGGKSKLFIIVNDAVGRFEVAAAPADVAMVETGDRASISLEAARGRSIEGRVTEIRKAQNVIVLSAPDAEERLEPGTAATARIVTDQRLDVLRAPNEALRYSRSRNAARVSAEGENFALMSFWVLRKGMPTPVRARLGLDDSAYTEIVEGDFEPGDKLIIGERD
ncbi:MAG: efflux RND transporter periplasmic adaptor subunit [Methylocystis sp.]|nr:efflux RND transporter periplasmic adaptor subunit [Methylocystis sp.]